MIVASEGGRNETGEPVQDSPDFLAYRRQLKLRAEAARRLPGGDPWTKHEEEAS